VYFVVVKRFRVFVRRFIALPWLISPTAFIGVPELDHAHPGFAVHGALARRPSSDSGHHPEDAEVAQAAMAGESPSATGRIPRRTADR
jgi:hypothetical protein